MYRRVYGDYVPGYGDPGIFGAIGHTLFGAAKGFITGGPVGAIFGAARGAGTATRANIEEATLAAGGGGSAYTPALRAAHAAVVARAKAGGVTRPIGGSTPGTAHHLFGGGVMGALGPGTRKRRRMNWANSKALGRAERRIHSAVKHFGRYFRWVHPGKPGHLAPKFRGKKKH